MAKETIHELVDTCVSQSVVMGEAVSKALWGQAYLAAKEVCSAAAKLMIRAEVLQDHTTSAYAKAEVDRALKAVKTGEAK